MNQEVRRFYSLVNETKALSGENDEDLMTKSTIFKLDRLFRFKPGNVSRKAPTTIQVSPKGKNGAFGQRDDDESELLNFQKVAEDLKVLQMSTDGMNPVDAVLSIGMGKTTTTSFGP
uniref:Uncharacterized protein n=1 Tax=Tanacetum cinerariifolium TaxID=118510 RepID=A0A6L2LJ72_TANCI|nr:hypothetical protein [Tanacetum cinerariifolium]